MKFILVLMIRNESKILERCLKAVEDLVEAFCIHDTGSTDNSCEIAEEFLKTHKGCLTKSEWSNFGFNRTCSFVEAHKFVNASPDFNPAETYGLLLDADMVFKPEDLKNHPLSGTGYTIVQKNGNLHYPNTRLVRMDYDWKCRGVTHEYWDGPTSALDESVCWIQDENDGGCKSDKFERDVRLLEKGLEEEPENVRYMFYLAQTYHSVGRWKDAIRMYKKRFNAGAWDEERWYALYMIGQSWLSLGDPIKFEKYMLKAYAFRSSRSENIYKLAKYFRENGDHYKSYHYAKLGRSIPLSRDSLFVESNIYNGLFDYEITICMYYLERPLDGLRESLVYLMKKTENLESVYKNMGFYIKPLDGEVVHHPVMRDVCGRDFHPTSISSCDGIDNIRFVNYSINHEGGYDMKKGNYSPNHNVITQNVVWNPISGSHIMKDSSVDLPRVPTHIRGLEDVRIYKDTKGAMRFVATSMEYEKDKVRMITGLYNMGSRSYSDCKVIASPLDAQCEKNWIPVSGTEDIVYSWNPLRVGTLVGNNLVFHTTHETPWLFRHIRGSAVPTRVGSDLWFLVHFVEYTSPRKYYHCLVSLDAKTYKPTAITLPFSFRESGIEYCLSMTIQPAGKIQFIVSSWDDNPCMVTIPMSTLNWTQV